jgi:ATP-dependent RNA helicase SUPV3L1/SUV3
MELPDQLDDAPATKIDRSTLRKRSESFGWTWINKRAVEVPCERTVRVGPRTVVVRGRVEIRIPADLTEVAGEAAASATADAIVAALRAELEQCAAHMLLEPDDQQHAHTFARPSFAQAARDAEHAVVQAYRQLADRRIDDRVEAELGLEFYLQGFTTAERTFHYFAGPTNSGKTYAALEQLRAAKTGVYLAPLRLLALEVYERLGELNVATSLVTGEERIIDPAADHVSSTVEMVDLKRLLDVAVIDEAQMLEDAQRGWAWTLAVAGVQAQRVILCGSEEGLHAARRLAARLGVTIAVQRFRRKNPLRVWPAVGLAGLQPGDALVAFSRKAVIELQGEVSRFGFSSAAIYGSLSPAVRRREADRFRSGQADILVATDAIGLGLNLPIRRIVFAATEKFDGASIRPLNVHEVRQIAGRAGRYGIHEEGRVTSLDARDLPMLRRCLEAGGPALTPERGPIWISPTDEHLRRLAPIIGSTRVSRLLQFFQTRVLQGDDEDVRIADLTDQIEVAYALESSPLFMRLPLEVRCAYSRAPVTTRGSALTILTRWGELHAAGDTVDGEELMTGTSSRDSLLLAEDRSRIATLYLWLSQRFPQAYANRESIALLREMLDGDIEAALLKRGARSKRKRKAKEKKAHARGR